MVFYIKSYADLEKVLNEQDLALIRDMWKIMIKKTGKSFERIFSA